MKKRADRDQPLDQTDPDNKLIATLSASIDGDYRYKSDLDVYYHPSTDGCTVEVTSVSPALGRDYYGDGFVEPLVKFQATISGPCKPSELIRAIRSAINKSSTIKRYGKPTINFRWVQTKDRGISVKKAAEALRTARELDQPRGATTIRTGRVRRIRRLARMRHLATCGKEHAMEDECGMMEEDACGDYGASMEYGMEEEDYLFDDEGDADYYEDDEFDVEPVPPRRRRTPPRPPRLPRGRLPVRRLSEMEEVYDPTFDDEMVYVDRWHDPRLNPNPPRRRRRKRTAPRSYSFSRSRRADWEEDVPFYDPRQSKHHWFCAIVPLGGPIWGSGRDCAEALEEAYEYIHDWNAIARTDREMIDPDALECYPCSEKVFRKVEKEGGDIKYSVINDVIYLKNELKTIDHIDLSQGRMPKKVKY